MRMLRNGARILGLLILPLTLRAQTFTVLHNFGSQDQDGMNPPAGVILGLHGELYGTAKTGGEFGFGTVYELLPAASSGGTWTEVAIHSFSGQDGQYPDAGLVRGPSGALYGTAGDSDGNAMVFVLSPPAGGSTFWTETILYQTPAVDYAYPGALVFGKERSLYGTYGEFSVYSLTPPSVVGGAWTEATLSNSGIWPVGTLAVGTDGTLYGASVSGGNGACNAGCGMVFSLTPPAAPGAPWTPRLLYTFEPETGDGFYPHAGVILAPSGVLYGTTSGGGHGRSGTVFSLTPSAVPDVPMIETIVHDFTEIHGDGLSPNASLVLDANGVLYGTTTWGGVAGLGTVFELAPPASPGGAWSETVLHSFLGDADGYEPNGIVLGSNGTLYGTTLYGGTSNYGTVFSLRP
ncbi:MAG: choice-of-anchor tandem repeat GloVer-containing protein [Bryobacteraceae bacterium]|jgi:uncharacterized repeat protein (TIGR03803 family)